MEPNYFKAITFLNGIRPGGPWVLSAIVPDLAGCRTQAFTDAEEAFNWLNQFGLTANLYWTINRPLGNLNSKSAKTGIHKMEYLHVDIDYDPKRNLDEEPARIKALLESPPNGIPRPTVTVFTGGGYQAFWKLQEPVIINGDLDKAEDAECYSLQLAIDLEADRCHNIDRIARLPFTINRPNRAKRERGRVPILSELLDMDMSRTYPLSMFGKAQKREKQTLKSGSLAVHLSGKVKRIGTIDELDKWSVPDRVKVAIVQGMDPMSPLSGDNSRSAWLFHVCCELVRREIPDDTIYAIITDPDFLISQSVLEHKGMSRDYALRQIERAKEEAIEPKLRELNEIHAVISNMGGRCRIIEEIMDTDLNRSRITHQTFVDFSNRYMHQRVKIGKGKDGKDIEAPLGKWWLQHPQRKQYRSIVFAPCKTVDDCYNLWRGFSVNPVQGDCSLFLGHLLHNICSGNDAYYRYLLGWLATMFQHPSQPGQVAIVLRGGQGTGKSFFAKTVGHLLGRHFMQVSDSKHLVGSFNAHLRDVILLFGDEAFYAGDKKHESVLKTLITEDNITIESKGIDAESCSNFIHLILASNSSWVHPAGVDERRYFALEVGEGAKKNSAYFGAIQSQMESGGYEALLYELLNYSLEGFSVRDVPQTKVLTEQKLFSMDTQQEWWHQKLFEGRVLSSHARWHSEVSRQELIQDYSNYMDRMRVFRRTNDTMLTKFIVSACPGAKLIYRDSSEHGRKLHYILPDLDTCRDHWNRRFNANLFEEAEPEMGTNEFPDLGHDDIM